MQQEEQKFPSEQGKYLWTSADQLRSNLETLQFKHLAVYMRESVSLPYNNKHK